MYFIPYFDTQLANIQLTKCHLRKDIGINKKSVVMVNFMTSFKAGKWVLDLVMLSFIEGYMNNTNAMFTS